MTGRGGQGARYRRNQRREASRSTYCAEPPQAPPPAQPRACSERWTGCGHACHCGVNWDTGEERPACPYGGAY